MEAIRSSLFECSHQASAECCLEITLRLARVNSVPSLGSWFTSASNAACHSILLGMSLNSTTTMMHFCTFTVRCFHATLSLSLSLSLSMYPLQAPRHIILRFRVHIAVIIR